MRKILIFHHYNSSLGAGLSLIHIVKTLNDGTNQIKVCIPEVPGDLDRKLKLMGVQVLYSNAVVPYMHFNGSNMKFVSKRHLKNIIAIKRARQEIESIIKYESPNIVVVNSMTLFWIGMQTMNLGIKSICFHRETYKRGILGLRTLYIKKHLCKDFTAVAFLSNYDMQQTPKGTAKFFRITDKVDVDLYQQLSKNECRISENLPTDCKLILYVGGMAKLKGPEVLIKSLSKIKNKDFKLVFLQYQPAKICGMKMRVKYWIKVIIGINLSHKIESIIKRKQLEKKIIFRPATDHVERYFVACDVVVFPCKNAHQARPIYEAGISKKPIVITDFPNYREFVDETSGWLFKKENAVDLAKCLDEALEYRALDKINKNYVKSYNINNFSSLKSELEELIVCVERG